MDCLNHTRLSDVQQVVVSLEVFFPILEPLPAKRGFVQFMALDHGPHGPVEDQDTFTEQLSNIVYRHDYLCLSVADFRRAATRAMTAIERASYRERTFFSKP